MSAVSASPAGTAATVTHTSLAGSSPAACAAAKPSAAAAAGAAVLSPVNGALDMKTATRANGGRLRSLSAFTGKSFTPQQNEAGEALRSVMLKALNFAKGKSDKSAAEQEKAKLKAYQRRVKLAPPNAIVSAPKPKEITPQQRAINSIIRGVEGLGIDKLGTWIEQVYTAVSSSNNPKQVANFKATQTQYLTELSSAKKAYDSAFAILIPTKINPDDLIQTQMEIHQNGDVNFLFKLL